MKKDTPFYSRKDKVENEKNSSYTCNVCLKIEILSCWCICHI